MINYPQIYRRYREKAHLQVDLLGEEIAEIEKNLDNLKHTKQDLREQEKHYRDQISHLWDDDHDEWRRLRHQIDNAFNPRIRDIDKDVEALEKLLDKKNKEKKLLEEDIEFIENNKFNISLPDIDTIPPGVIMEIIRVMATEITSLMLNKNVRIKFVNDLSAPLASVPIEFSGRKRCINLSTRWIMEQPHRAPDLLDMYRALIIHEAGHLRLHMKEEWKRYQKVRKLFWDLQKTDSLFFSLFNLLLDEQLERIYRDCMPGWRHCFNSLYRDSRMFSLTKFKISLHQNYYSHIPLRNIDTTELEEAGLIKVYDQPSGKKVNIISGRMFDEKYGTERPFAFYYMLRFNLSLKSVKERWLKDCLALIPGNFKQLSIFEIHELALKIYNIISDKPMGATKYIFRFSDGNIVLKLPGEPGNERFENPVVKEIFVGAAASSKTGKKIRRGNDADSFFSEIETQEEFQIPGINSTNGTNLPPMAVHDDSVEFNLHIKPGLKPGRVRINPEISDAERNKLIARLGFGNQKRKKRKQRVSKRSRKSDWNRMEPPRSNFGKDPYLNTSRWTPPDQPGIPPDKNQPHPKQERIQEEEIPSMDLDLMERISREDFNRTNTITFPPLESVIELFPDQTQNRELCRKASNAKRVLVPFFLHVHENRAMEEFLIGGRRIQGGSLKKFAIYREQRIFRDTRPVMQMDFTGLKVCLLIDSSGSMKYQEKLNKAKLVATAIGECIRECAGLESAYYGFDRNLYLCGNHAQPSIASLENTEDENEAAALDYIVTDIRSSNCKAALVVVFSDGMPVISSVAAAKHVVSQASITGKIFFIHAALSSIVHPAYKNRVDFSGELTNTRLIELGKLIYSFFEINV